VQKKKAGVIGGREEEGFIGWCEDDMDVSEDQDDEDDDDEDDDDAQDRAMMVEDPNVPKRRDGDDDDQGASSGSKQSGDLSKQPQTSNPGSGSAGSTSASPGKSTVGMHTAGGYLPNSNDELRARTIAIATSKLPQHVVGHGRVKTLIVQEGAKEAAMISASRTSSVSDRELSSLTPSTKVAQTRYF
jgi:hypothetical protein